jgi:peroxiredoxin
MSVDVKDNYLVGGLWRSLWFWVGVTGLVLGLGLGWIAYSRALVGGMATAKDGAPKLEPAPIAGYPAPDFELANLKGEKVRLSDYRGMPVILNFWATWCGPCRAEFPEFQAAAVDNADRLVIIGVNNTYADNPEAVPEFVREMGVTFPILLDNEQQVVNAYNVLGLPTTVFIDSKGVVNEVFTGPLNKAYIESKIQELQTGL